MSFSIRHILRKVVHIHPDEDRAFLFLSTHAFFNGLGVALAFAAINIIVIKKQSIDILPWLYVASSVLMILSGVFYNKLEHAFPPKKVFIFSLVFCVSWAFVMRFLLSPDNSMFFIGLAYSSYYLIQVLTNLDLWGSAALVFNVRQSKRLFGPLSFSESIGGIIGYSFSPIIVKYIAVQDMMVLSGLSFLISAIVLYNMRNRYLQGDHTEHKSHHSLHEPVHHHTKDGFWSRLFHHNEYIKRLSVLILLSTLVYYLITYGFLSRVEVQFKSLTDIAWFIGLFLSSVKIMNLLIKFVFSSHVFSKLGIHFGLVLLPLIIITISGAGLTLLMSGVDSPLFYIYLFSALYFFDKLFRSSLSKPSYLIMFQPMSPTMRLAGHTITKGYFEPLAMGLAGGIILLLDYIEWYSLKTLLIHILIISVFWLLACRVGIKQYLVELQDALKNRLFGMNAYRLSQQEIDLVTDMKLNSESDLDRLYALSLLRGKIPKTKEIATYESLLSSENDSIVKTSLMKIEEEKLPVEKGALLTLITNKRDDIRIRAAYAMASVYGESSIDLLVDAIENNPDVNNPFIGALIKYAGIHGTLAVGGKLLALTKSALPSDRILAANIIEETDSREYNALLLKFLADEDEAVKIAGIKACSDTADDLLMKEVFALLVDRKYLSAIKQCVQSNNKVAFHELNRVFPSANHLLKKRLIEVSSKIKLPEYTAFLLKQLDGKKYALHSEVIRTLYYQRFVPINLEQRKIVHRTIEYMLTELSQLEKLHRGMDDKIKLRGGVRSEIESIGIVNVLRLLSFIYNKTTVDKIIRHLSAQGDTADLANSIELLENLLPNKWSRTLVAVIETIYEPSTTGRHDDKKQILSMVDLVGNEQIHISDFLFGLLIRTASIFNLPLGEQLIDVARSKKSPIIAEELLRQSR